MRNATGDDQFDALTAALAGRYRLERELGRGGMATVYLADDLRHRRQVAVKVLHPELGAAVGAERFLREIEVTAGLHHPHILPLHDSGEAGGFLYYVMPFVEGESLRERLTRERQFPVDDAVRIACDVASALDYAHRHGVVHRDTKPENILLQDGRALVADFGVARAVQRATDGRTLTGTGITVGTPHYMSPEQAAGERDLDGRTDVFSLGCVVYEMLAGIPPFVGPTAQAVIAKVVAETPRPITDERRAVPPNIGAAVMRALEKVPADRFLTAAQFATALASPGSTPQTAGVASHADSATGTGATRAFRFTRRDAVWTVATVVIALSAVAASARSLRNHESSSSRTQAFVIPVADSQRIGGAPWPLAISPDGQTVVYVGESGPGRRLLYRRRLGELTVEPLVGTDGAVGPFFSPDGRWIAFNDAADRIRRIPTDGGNVATIVGSARGSAHAWGPNDVIVGSSDSGLFRTSVSGESFQPLTTLDTARREVGHNAPRILADGRTVVFRIGGSTLGDANRIGVISLDARASAGERTARHITLDMPGGTPLGYADGMLIVGRPDGTIIAARVDLPGGRMIGEPVTVLDRVVWSRGSSASLGADGSLVYLRGGGGAQLTLVDEHGAVTGGREDRRRFQYPRFSPDGRRIAVQVVSGEATGGDIWVYDISSSVLSRLTSRGDAARPEWTFDGKHISYITAGSDRPAEAWWIPSDGSGTEERLYAGPGGGSGVGELVFAPTGGLAVLRSSRGAPRFNDLWLLSLDAAGIPAHDAARLTETPFSEAMPRISPDGKWLAYASDESGQYEIYVRPFPRQGGRVQVSNDGGAEPVWAPDGRRLFYRNGDSVMEASLTIDVSSAGVEVTGRKKMFEGRFVSALPLITPAQYDMDPNGKRFVVLRQNTEDRELVVIVNWLADVRARVQAAGRR